MIEKVINMALEIQEKQIYDLKEQLNKLQGENKILKHDILQSELDRVKDKNSYEYRSSLNSIYNNKSLILADNYYTKIFADLINKYSYETIEHELLIRADEYFKEQEKPEEEEDE